LPAVVGVAGALSLAEVNAQIQLIQHLMKTHMTEGEHYGVIEGTKKPSLYKAGAEKICLIFQFTPRFETTERDLPGGHREYRTKCSLYTRAGLLMAECDAVCSTMESRYRYRNSERKCPKCEQPTIIKGREEYGGGWICFAKKGGCGAKFRDGDQSIEGQQPGKIEHPDPADYFNTAIKMSNKRAFVGAVLFATAASDIFTQDIEDMPEELIGGRGKPEVKAAPIHKANGQPQQPKKVDPVAQAPAPDDFNQSPQPVTRPNQPAPLENPWLHKLEGVKGADGRNMLMLHGKQLWEVPQAWFKKATLPAFSNKLSDADFANVMAALETPELKEAAAAQVLEALDKGITSGVPLEQDSVPEFTNS